MDLQDAFSIFFEKIELSPLTEDRIESAWNRLHEHLVAAYGVTVQAVFVQGSTANGTAVKPEDHDGEVDLDIIAHAVPADTPANDALDQLRAHLEADGDLAKRLTPDEPGRPCVRLKYARDPDDGFGFHIDITPARTGQEDGPLDVPMRGREGWKATAPSEYATWCHDRGEPFRRTVRMLKRWREHDDAAIKSIVLQVLVADAMAATGSDAQRVVAALTGIRDRLASSPRTPPEIPNPVLPSENLAGRWSDEDYRRFRVQVGDAADRAQRALNASESATAHSHWKLLFGDAFPSAPPRTGGLTPPPPPPPTQRPNPDRGRRYG